MNHIKLFEELRIGEDGYEPITYEMYESSVSSSRTMGIRANFIYPEIKILRDKFNSVSYNTSYAEIRFNSRVSAIIYKLEDEWYYVQFKNGRISNYFKCDQFDGLINCLDTGCKYANAI